MKEYVRATREHADMPLASHIPPYEAWTPEAAQTYLNDDGTLKINKRTGNFEFDQIETPLIDKDEYPVVDIHALVTLGVSLFRPGYRFPNVARTKNGIITVKDNIDHAQHDEIFYHPDNHGGSTIPERFRDSNKNKYRCPWLYHNAKTDLFIPPPVPPMDIMNVDTLSSDLTTKALVSGIVLIKAGCSFPIRAESIRAGHLSPQDEDDSNGKKYLSNRHKEAYEQFKRARDNLQYLPEHTPYTHLRETLADSKPIEVVRILGSIATTTPWNYSPFIRGRGARSPISKNPRANIMLTSALRVI